jgi:cytoskeletal protein CcmA (bactofilin family)
MTGSVVNTIVQSTWATGSGGTRVTYGSTITANAQSASATITLSAGNAASNNAGGTASIAAGLIRIGTHASQTISSTGSFGPMIIVGSGSFPAISVRSGSFELTTPQGSGSFYSNCPITSSGLRINGTALVNDLIISGVFSGNSSLQVTANASVTQSLNVGNQLYVGGQLDVNSIGGARGISITGSAPTIVSGSLSGSLISNLGDIYTGSNNANFIVTLGSASMASLIAAASTNPNTLYIVI